jgi:hypothetical protein
MSTIADSNVPDNATISNGDDDDSATIAALSKAFGDEDAETPSKTEADDETDEQSDEDTEGSETETDEDGDDGDEKSTEDDEDEGEDEEANEDKVVLKDDFKVKVPVNGVEQEFTIGSLKRLAGQEASLTQKSQEVATKRKELDTSAATQVAALKVLIERAQKRFEPYSKMDILALSRDPSISNEELTALRDAGTAAQQDVHFLTQELGAFTKALQDQRSKELREQAIETVKVLSEGEKAIPGFSDKMYGEMMQYASSQGVSNDAISELVDPISLSILHKAMLYDRGAAKVKQESDPKTKTNKKVKAPKKIVKSITNTDEGKKKLKGGKGDKEQEALKRLQRSGSDEDAAAAFAARFARDDED